MAIWILSGLAVVFALAFVVALACWHKANLDRLRSEFAALAAEKLEGYMVFWTFSARHRAGRERATASRVSE